VSTYCNSKGVTAYPYMRKFSTLKIDRARIAKYGNEKPVHQYYVQCSSCHNSYDVLYVLPLGLYDDTEGWIFMDATAENYNL